MNLKIKKFIYLSVILFTIGLLAINVVDFLWYPAQLNVLLGEDRIIEIAYPFRITDTENHDVIAISEVNSDISEGKKVKLTPLKNGNTNIQIKFLGILPVKKLRIDVLPKVKLIPGGSSIGVKLNTKGVLVVGLEEIEGIDGKMYNPGYDGGLRIGDCITEVNGKAVKDADHVIELINLYKGKNLKIKAKRNDASVKFSIEPIKSKIYNDYKLGLWVKDKTAGVGTLTFVEPKSKTYGALGHAISDASTGKILPVGKGEILKSKVVSIKQGQRGQAGEIRGIFLETSDPLGKLTKNTSYGIYGKVYDIDNCGLDNKPLEIALQNEIKLGPAKILTTTDDNCIKEYDVIIERVNLQRKKDTKSMVVRIVDKELLKKTGGIVQGMSGSPIIQNNKIVGAVTHVFLNDPTKGYGIFIEWMLNESGVDLKRSK